MEKAPQKKRNGTWLQSMTRLMIGGVEVGLSKLLTNLQRWDEELKNQPAMNEEAKTQDLMEEVSPETVTEILEGQVIDIEEDIPPAVEDASVIHHAMVGLVFEAEDSLLRGIELLDRGSRVISRKSEPWLRPVRNSRLVKPFSQQIDRLAERGENEVKRWIERGRIESVQSRDLVEKAISSTVEHNIEYLTTNPEVQELVQQQSSGLANEILEEVRERTVSADNFLEGVARRVLRRTPRQQLPEPPPEVIKRASTIRPHKVKGTPK
jgi:hypothetical protein